MSTETELASLRRYCNDLERVLSSVELQVEACPCDCDACTDLAVSLASFERRGGRLHPESTVRKDGRRVNA